METTMETNTETKERNKLILDTSDDKCMMIILEKEIRDTDISFKLHKPQISLKYGAAYVTRYAVNNGCNVDLSPFDVPRDVVDDFYDEIANLKKDHGKVKFGKFPEFCGSYGEMAKLNSVHLIRAAFE